MLKFAQDLSKTHSTIQKKKKRGVLQLLGTMQFEFEFLIFCS
jgi:hypothetical protein